MFWGISLEVGKRYSQTVEKSFHISMAALNASTGSTAKGSVTIMVEVEKACYPLCTLHPEKIPQQALDYVFTEGEEVLFYTEGDLEVHLTGYLLDEPNAIEYSSEEEEESAANSDASSCDEANKQSSEEENLESLISELDGLNEDNEGNIDVLLPRSARKKQKSGDTLEEMATQAFLSEKLLDDDSESEDDDDWQPGCKRKLSKKKSEAQAEEKAAKSDKKMDNSSSHKDAKSNKTESNSSPSKQLLLPKTKKQGLKNKDVNNSNGLQEDTVTGLEDVSVDKNCSQDEKSQNVESKNKVDVQNSEDKPHHERKELPGGTIIEDITKGQGKKAKKGRQVSLYYKGSLKKSKKQFDSCLEGKPFTFRLGGGEVIKGWDIGIEGMQVGGKRRITIPPSQGYGSKPMGSSIPANSTLVFVVELLKVH